MDDAAKLIRGQKGSHVILTIERFGYDEWIDYDLVRENITVQDVSYSGMINETTGYIRLVRFSKNSAKEMEKALTNILTNDMYVRKSIHSSALVVSVVTITATINKEMSPNIILHTLDTFCPPVL